jgi:hypothetical protein
MRSPWIWSGVAVAALGCRYAPRETIVMIVAPPPIVVAPAPAAPAPVRLLPPCGCQLCGGIWCDPASVDLVLRAQEQR